MRLQDRTVVTTKAGRSRTDTLARALHQLHSDRRTYVKALSSLPDGGFTLHRAHNPLT
jgi:hypothetical protein